MLLRETSTATKPEAAPGFTTRTGTRGGVGGKQAWMPSVTLSRQEFLRPVSSKPLPYPFSGDRAAQGADGQMVDTPHSISGFLL